MHLKFLMLVFLALASTSNACEDLDFMMDDVFDYFESDEDNSSEKPANTTQTPTTVGTTRKPLGNSGTNNNLVATPFSSTPSPPEQPIVDSTNMSSSARSRMLQDTPKAGKHRRRKTHRRRRVVRKRPMTLLNRKMEDDTEKGRVFDAEGDIFDKSLISKEQQTGRHFNDRTKHFEFGESAVNMDDFIGKLRTFTNGQVPEDVEQHGDIQFRAFPMNGQREMFELKFFDTEEGDDVIEKKHQRRGNVIIVTPSYINIKDRRGESDEDVDDDKFTLHNLKNVKKHLPHSRKTSTPPDKVRYFIIMNSKSTDDDRKHIMVNMHNKKHWNKENYDSIKHHGYDHRTPVSNRNRFRLQHHQQEQPNKVDEPNKQNAPHYHIHVSVEDKRIPPKQNIYNHIMLQEKNPRRPLLMMDSDEELSDIYKLVEEPHFKKISNLHPSEMNHVNYVRDHAIRKTVKLNPSDHSEIQEIREKIRSSLIKNPHVPMTLQLKDPNTIKEGDHQPSKLNKMKVQQLPAPAVHTYAERFPYTAMKTENQTTTDKNIDKESPDLHIQQLPMIDSSIHFHRDKPHQPHESFTMAPHSLTNIYHQSQSYPVSYPINNPSLVQNPSFYPTAHQYHEMDATLTKPASQSHSHQPYPTAQFGSSHSQLPLVDMLTNFHGKNVEHMNNAMHHSENVNPITTGLIINSTVPVMHPIKSSA